MPKPELQIQSSSLSVIGISSLAQLGNNGVVRRLGAPVLVKQQGLSGGHPRLLVADAPDGDALALGHVEAGADDGGVVVGGRTGDVELGDGDLGGAGAGEGFEGGLDVTRHVCCQVGLGACVAVVLVIPCFIS